MPVEDMIWVNCYITQFNEDVITYTYPDLFSLLGRNMWNMPCNGGGHYLLPCVVAHAKNLLNMMEIRSYSDKCLLSL